MRRLVRSGAVRLAMVKYEHMCYSGTTGRQSPELTHRSIVTRCNPCHIDTLDMAEYMRDDANTVGQATDGKGRDVAERIDGLLIVLGRDAIEVRICPDQGIVVDCVGGQAVFRPDHGSAELFRHELARRRRTTPCVELADGPLQTIDG